MCNCKKIEMGAYDNQCIQITPWNDTFVWIDKCLADEINYLWDNKIRTTGCCCGHNKAKPMINVIPEHHQRMKDLGYAHWINKSGVVMYDPQFI